MIFYNEVTWLKKVREGMFDVMMESFDSDKIFELIGIYILHELSKII